MRITRNPAKRALERAGLAPALISLLVDSLLRYTVLVFALVMALDQFGVAIGVAAQDSVANVISGFLIFLDKHFQAGDWVNVVNHQG